MEHLTQVRFYNKLQQKTEWDNPFLHVILKVNSSSDGSSKSVLQNIRYNNIPNLHHLDRSVSSRLNLSSATGNLYTMGLPGPWMFSRGDCTTPGREISWFANDIFVGTEIVLLNFPSFPLFLTPLILISYSVSPFRPDILYSHERLTVLPVFHGPLLRILCFTS